MQGDAEYTDSTNEREMDYFELLHETVFQTIYWFVKYLPAPAGCFLRFLVLKIFMKKIESWKIMEGATFFFPRNISIGKHCFIHDYVTMGGRGEIIIGDYVSLAHNVSVYSEDHAFRKGKYFHLQGMVRHTTIIEDDVGCGGASRVLPGARIGRGTLIGPNSVVTGKVPPGAFMSGIPARVVGWRGEGPGIDWIKSTKSSTGDGSGGETRSENRTEIS